jgi:hypothetical protein
MAAFRYLRPTGAAEPRGSTDLPGVRSPSEASDGEAG